MLTTKTKRRVRRVTDGYINPECLYTSEGCMTQFGLGRESLDEARQSGIVKPIEHGRRLYWLGEELIAWLKSKRK